LLACQFARSFSAIPHFAFDLVNFEIRNPKSEIELIPHS